MSPLQRQLLPINIGAGLDTKTDDKKVISSKLLTLENGVFTTPGRIRKRNGYTDLGNTIFGGGNNVSAKAAFNYDGQLNKAADNGLYSYLPDNSSSILRSPAYSVSASNAQIVQGSITPAYSDMAQVGSYQVYSYNEVTSTETTGTHPTSSTYVTVIDSTTGAYVFDAYRNLAVLQSDGAVRCITAGNRVIMIAESAAAGVGHHGYYGYYFDSTNPSASIQSTTTPLFNDAVNTNLSAGVRPLPALYFDAVALNGGVVMAYLTNQNVTVALIGSNLTIGTTTTISLGAVDFVNQIAIAVDPANNNVWVILTAEVGGVTKVDYFVLDQTLTVTVKALQTNIFPSSTTFTNITLAKTATTTMSVLVEQPTDLDITIDKPTLHLVLIGSIDTGTYVVTEPTAYTINVNSHNPGTSLISVGGLASRIFQIDGISYVNTVFQSDVQPCYFTVRLDGFIVAQMLPNLAFGLPPNRIVPQVTVSSEIAQVPMAVTVARFEGSVFAAGITLETLDFSNSIADFQNTQLDKNQFITGTLPSVYDGAQFYEAGFLLFPEQMTANVAGGGSLTGTYQYVAIYEFNDRNGQRRQSAPSIPVSVVASSSTIDLTIPAPVMSNYGFNGLDQSSRIQINIFRTDANGTVFHRLTQAAFSNGTSGSSVQIVTQTDDTPDATIDSNELLYTTGGILDNDPPPACTSCTIFDGRIWLFGEENSSVISYSKPFTNGTPVSFSDAFTIQMPTRGGPALSGARLDSNLIVFKQSSAFLITGTGPNNAGQNFAYQDPFELISPVGCAYPKSIVTIPAGSYGPGGLVFKSDKGFWELDRSLQFRYIGADVEAYNNFNVISSQALENQNQVRFVLDSGDILVYDYYVGQWAVFTGIPAVGSTIYLNEYTYVDSTGKFFQETPGFFQDGTSPISLKIGTAWIKLTDIQNFERIRRLFVIGDYRSKHLLNGEVYFDYETNVGATFQFNPQNALGFHGDDSVYQFRYHMERQKFESVRFVIFDSFASYTPGEGYDLSQLSIEAALKQGGNKLSPYKSVG
jgi:hypothetical protein